MARKTVHVVPHKDGWAVQTSGSEKPHRVTQTQQEAIEIGRGVAINQQTELFIHNREGQIRERNSYGSDPFPPKG